MGEELKIMNLKTTFGEREEGGSQMTTTRINIQMAENGAAAKAARRISRAANEIKRPDLRGVF